MPRSNEARGHGCGACTPEPGSHSPRSPETTAVRGPLTAAKNGPARGNRESLLSDEDPARSKINLSIFFFLKKERLEKGKTKENSLG